MAFANTTLTTEIEEPTAGTYRSPFAKYTYNTARSALEDSKGEGYQENRDLVSGEHFKDGEYYVGPPGKDNPAYEKAKKKVETQFVFRDVTSEIVNRVVNGVAKQEPKLDAANRDSTVKDTDELKKRRKKWLAALTVWWDSVGFQRKLRKAIRRSRWAEVKSDNDDREACGYLRLWIPLSQLEDIPEDELGDLPAGSKRVPTGTFEETISRIRLSAPDPSSCAILIDEETDQKASVFAFKRGKKEFIELAWVEYNDDGTPGDTVVRVISGVTRGPQNRTEEYRWKLGGRLPVVEIRAPLLVTKAIREQQKHLNFYETLLLRNVEAAGWPERVITNAEQSGILVPLDVRNPGPYPTREINGKMYEVHPVPRVLGAGLTTEIVGIKLTDEDTGKSVITTPGVERFDPVDPDYTIRSCRHGYQRMLEEANQAHILIVGDATASGVSRQQAEGDHLSDLTDTKDPAEGGAREVLETLTAMGEFFSQSGEKYLVDFRIVAILFVTPGTPTPDQQRVAYELRDKGALDETEFLSRIGIEDTVAMSSSLITDPVAKAVRLVKLADAVTKLKLAGWTFEGAMKELGFTDEQITNAMTGTPNPDPAQTGAPPAPGLPASGRKGRIPTANQPRGTQSNLNGGRPTATGSPQRKQRPALVK